MDCFVCTSVYSNSLIYEKNEYYLHPENIVECETGRFLWAAQSNLGHEYVSSELQNHCSGQSIDHQHTSAYSPHLNGVAERMDRTLLNLV